MSAHAQISSSGSRVDATLAAAASFYEATLWGPDHDRVRRMFLGGRALEDELLRRFRVGYAPLGWTTTGDHLRSLGFTAEEIAAAGLVSTSHRRDDRHYDLFRSRLMFPMVDADGNLTGFAGRATHPGPSWPRWVISPKSSRFSGQNAIFGLDQAAPAIRSKGEAVVLGDCLDVLTHHQRGRRETVAVIRSHLTAEHLERLRRCGMRATRAVFP